MLIVENKKIMKNISCKYPNNMSLLTEQHLIPYILSSQILELLISIISYQIFQHVNSIVMLMQIRESKSSSTDGVLQHSVGGRQETTQFFNHRVSKIELTDDEDQFLTMKALATSNSMQVDLLLQVCKHNMSSSYSSTLASYQHHLSICA